MTKPTQSGINERIALEDINIGGTQATEPTGGEAKVGPLKTLSLFLAGMYTGIGCAGTPHDFRKKDSAGRDNRPV